MSRLMRAFAKSGPALVVAHVNGELVPTQVRLYKDLNGIQVITNNTVEPISPFDGSKLTAAAEDTIEVTKEEMESLVPVAECSECDVTLSVEAGTVDKFSDGDKLHCLVCNEKIAVQKTTAGEDEDEDEDEEEPTEENPDEDDEEEGEDEDEGEKEEASAEVAPPADGKAEVKETKTEDKPAAEVKEPAKTDAVQAKEVKAEETKIEDKPAVEVKIEETPKAEDAPAVEAKAEDESAKETKTEEAPAVAEPEAKEAAPVEDAKPEGITISVSGYDTLLAAANDEIAASVALSSKDIDPVIILSSKGMPLARCVWAKATPTNRELFDDPMKFINAFSIAVNAKESIAALEEAFGLEPISFTATVDETVKKLVEDGITEAKAALAKQREDDVADTKQLINIAALGLTKNFFTERKNPIREAMVSKLKTLSVKNAERIVDSVLAETVEGFVTELMAQANELRGKTPETRNEIATLVAKANYSALAAIDVESTADRLAKGNVGLSIVSDKQERVEETAADRSDTGSNVTDLRKRLKLGSR